MCIYKKLSSSHAFTVSLCPSVQLDDVIPGTGQSQGKEPWEDEADALIKWTKNLDEDGLWSYNSYCLMHTHL